MAELTPDQAVRLLHTLAAKLEQQSEIQLDPSISVLSFLFADVALIATLLADYIERSLPSQEVQEAMRLFKEGFDEGRPDA